MTEQEWLNACPVCDYCGEKITSDNYYRIGDKCYHEECVEVCETALYVEAHTGNEFVVYGGY